MRVVVVHLKMLKVCLFTILCVSKNERTEECDYFRCFFVTYSTCTALVQLIVVLCTYVCVCMFGIKKANVNIYATIRLSLYLFCVLLSPVVSFMQFRFYVCHAEIFASIFDFFWSLGIFAQVWKFSTFFFLFSVVFTHIQKKHTVKLNMKKLRDGKMCSTELLSVQTGYFQSKYESIYCNKWKWLLLCNTKHSLSILKFFKQMKIRFFVDSLGHHFNEQWFERTNG